MASAQYCGNCGETLIERASFCRSCGASLSDSTANGVRAVSPERPMIGFIDAIKLGFKNYVNFGGRSTPAELWWWVLFCFLIVWVFGGWILGAVGTFVPVIDPLRFIVFYGLIVPSLAVSSRRLHDINKSSWWLLLLFVPVLGWIVLIVWSIKKGDKGPNRYGLYPRQPISQ